ncbi:MAG: hypothetical protein ABI664_11710 [bacterium]
MTLAKIRTLGACMLLTLAVARPAHGQVDYQLRVTPELRADVVRINDSFGVEGGGGVQLPFGYYTRVGVIASAGAVESEANGKLDLVARFLFDPFLQQRWGLSAGAGVSFRARAHDHVRPYLLTVIDLEGPHSATGLSPSIQLGLGGGIRLGGALRWGAARNR